jgi:FAD/FMN-containing dehydrogenase
MTMAARIEALARDLRGLAVATDRATRDAKSRDFYWYSPILAAQLDGRVADLVVTPRDEAEVMRVAAACAKHRVPLTCRGAGTGNYGQCTPLAGGVVLDLSAMNRILGIHSGWASVEAGAILLDVDDAARRDGQMILMYPSTGRIATVGGFIAGGHSGIGSIRHGILADPGNVRRIRVVTLEETPRIVELTAPEDIPKVHHAYGTNGIITTLDIALAPAVDWVHCIATFPSYADVLRFGIAAGGHAVARTGGIDVYLLSAVERRFTEYYDAYAEFVHGRDAMFALVAPESVDAFFALARSLGGERAMALPERELAACGLLPVTECAYNHTTLMALKKDKTVTYLQVAFPAPLDVALVERFMAHFGAELYMHHEFSRMYGKLVSFALPLVFYFDAERIDEIIAHFESQGCHVFNPHTYILEDGGMKTIDRAQIAFKRAADPLGLMNPGKTRGERES